MTLLALLPLTFFWPKVKTRIMEIIGSKQQKMLASSMRIPHPCLPGSEFLFVRFFDVAKLDIIFGWPGCPSVRPQKFLRQFLLLVQLLLLLLLLLGTGLLQIIIRPPYHRVTSTRIQIQSRGSFQNNFLFVTQSHI